MTSHEKAAIQQPHHPTKKPQQSTPVRGQIFVAYAYSLYPKDDCRKIYAEIEASYPVKFIFADEKITNMQIMAKIESYIRSADFSIFDISGWNPNVTLELGFAMATNTDSYISFNPKHTDLSDVPSDIRGIDRIQYTSLTEYADKLLALMDQRYPKIERKASIADYLEGMQVDALTLLSRSPGLKIAEIAELLSVDVRMAQVVIAPLIGNQVRSEGVKKGTKYYADNAA